MLFRKEQITDAMDRPTGDQRFFVDDREVSEEAFLAEFLDAQTRGPVKARASGDWYAASVEVSPGRPWKLPEESQVTDWRKRWTPQLSPYPGPGPPVPWKVPPMTGTVPFREKVEVISFAEFERRWNIGTNRDRARILDRLAHRSLSIDVHTGTEKANEIVIEA